jgi:hypothetical protein
MQRAIAAASTGKACRPRNPRGRMRKPGDQKVPAKESRCAPPDIPPADAGFAMRRTRTYSLR